MSGLDPNILLSYKPIQIDNPADQYGKMLQLQGLQNSNALAKMQTDEYQSEAGNRNALKQYYSSSNFNPENTNELLKFGKSGQEAAKFLSDQRKAKLDAGKSQEDFLSAKLKNVQSLYDQIDPDAPNAGQMMLSIQRAVSNDPEIGPWLKSKGVNLEDAQANLESSINSGNILQALVAAKEGTAKAHESILMQRDNGGSTWVDRIPKFGNKGVVMVPNSQRAMTLSPNRAQTNITVNNKAATSLEKSLGEKMGADVYDTYSRARGATKTYDTGKNIEKLVTNGNFINGSFADQKLFLAKVIPGVDSKKITNTEQLRQTFNKAVLTALPSAGLGTGRGITDKDIELVRDANSGDLTLDKKTMLEVASFLKRLSLRNAAEWNETYDRVPGETLNGAALQNTKIDLRKFK
jgi:hypothetical protein